MDSWGTPASATPQGWGSTSASNSPWNASAALAAGGAPPGTAEPSLSEGGPAEPGIDAAGPVRPEGNDSWEQQSKSMVQSFASAPLDNAPKEEQKQSSAVVVEALTPTASIEDVWPEFKAADNLRDLDDVKPALALLCGAFQGKTWQEMEKKLRDEKCNTYLLASEDNVSFGYTLVNLKAEPNQQFRVLPSFLKPGTVKSGRMSIGMASTYEENFERLANAGVVRPSGIPRCLNCKEEGHRSFECPQEKMLPERSEFYGKCYNCGATDHRSRNCPEPRKTMVCKNCSQDGHLARDCDQPPAPIVCNRCNQEGHLSRDCDQPRTDMTCHRCGEVGHMSRDCDQPRTDMSCNRCGEVGHMSRDCEQPAPPMVCNRCNGEGHMARDCDQPRTDITCNRCGQVGHTSRDCDQPRTDMSCYNCGQPGHSSRDCDQPYQPNAAGMRCYKCNESGHKSFDCPNEEAGARRRMSRYGFDQGF
ncbi:cellular nucleic acid-binding protein [Entomortierella parvispora]|uniref:Cellular nucleic acid-binding protein n=1 Tax=Entomortierella parvispora TaxID=205924 RepID=A0A9P3H6I7_9FUNG|nr:cellular nucleic acid-binding protein [Entomortierella parvispora]